MKEIYETEAPNPSLASPLHGLGALSFGFFVAILLKRKRLILGCGLVTLALSTALAFSLAPSFSATTSFVPPGSSGASSSAALMGQLSALSGGASLLGGRSQGDLYVGILKSHTIGRYMVDRFNLEQVYKVKKESIAEKALAQRTLFELGSKDPIVTITVTDGSPQRARDLANGYLDALQQTSGQLSLSESSQRRLFFERRLAKEKDDLADAEVALKQSEEHTGLIAMGVQTSSAIQTAAQLNAAITQRQTQLSGLLMGESDENPDVLRMRSEISSLQAQVKRMQSGASKASFGEFSAARAPGLELEYIRRARDVKYHETLFDVISKQYEAARLDEAKDAPLQVLDRATVPDLKSGPHRSIIMLIGLLIGLLGGAVWVLIQQARRPETLAT
ncbi:GNVR domain-containing protein [Acidipila sp. EB88]|uniref:GNVR domain-containing protein n=1 Tax=Acidipila sp. EB88 TaxID=2305226 RepID=UPI000F5E0444|nr:GNVR domain-containing protein [Acidipila sp. EB88]RRA47459.1 lipopolysaccharide biosynthesis protein [Acidipila sp. EB88]